MIADFAVPSARRWVLDRWPAVPPAPDGRRRDSPFLEVVVDRPLPNPFTLNSFHHLLSQHRSQGKVRQPVFCCVNESDREQSDPDVPVFGRKTDVRTVSVCLFVLPARPDAVRIMKCQ